MIGIFVEREVREAGVGAGIGCELVGCVRWAWRRGWGSELVGCVRWVWGRGRVASWCGV